MKWKTPSRLKHGDQRVSKYFAFVPTNLSDGNTVWLECYYARERLCANYADPYWETIEISSTPQQLEE